VTDLNELSNDLDGTLRRTGTDISWLQPAVLRLLAEGSPVGLDRLADVTGRSEGDVRTALDAMPDTEFDRDGRVVGWGITLRETPHRFTVDGHQLFTWCALDTLMFPTIIGRPAQVSSPSAASGAGVRVEVEPDRIVAVDPPDAVVSIVIPGEMSSIRGAFCNRVHFFTSPDDARGWLDDHPDGQVFPVAEAYALGRRLAEQMLSGDNRCC
jgi:alkylmercury lyase